MDAVRRSMEARKLSESQQNIADTFIEKYTKRWGAASSLEITIIKALVKSLTDSDVIDEQYIREQVKNAGG